MHARIRYRIQNGGLEPPDTDLLDSPLGFIAEAHLHIRAVCAEMERLAGADAVESDAAMRVLRFLTEELPLVISDEDEDLFPLLLRRSEPEDDLPRLKTRLDEEHSKVMAVVPAVKEAFERPAVDAGRLSAQDRASVATFTRHMRRHIVFENAIILPFARLRLTAQDLETLRLRMRERRGLYSEEEKTHA